jgi:hypothetical protein
MYIFVVDICTEPVIFLFTGARRAQERKRNMENIANAFNAIADMAHEWAEDFAGERGRDYDDVRARPGERNIYFRDALEEMQWQASDASRQPVDPSFEIEF